MHFECAIKVEKCFVSIDLFTKHQSIYQSSTLFLTVASLNDYNLETVLFCYPNRTKNRHTLAEKEAVWET